MPTLYYIGLMVAGLGAMGVGGYGAYKSSTGGGRRKK